MDCRRHLRCQNWTVPWVTVVDIPSGLACGGEEAQMRVNELARLHLWNRKQILLNFAQSLWRQLSWIPCFATQLLITTPQVASGKARFPLSVHEVRWWQHHLAPDFQGLAWNLVSAFQRVAEWAISLGRAWNLSREVTRWAFSNSPKVTQLVPGRRNEREWIAQEGPHHREPWPPDKSLGETPWFSRQQEARKLVFEKWHMKIGVCGGLVRQLRVGESRVRRGCRPRDRLSSQYTVISYRAPFTSLWGKRVFENVKCSFVAYYYYYYYPRTFFPRLF